MEWGKHSHGSEVFFLVSMGIKLRNDILISPLLWPFPSVHVHGSVHLMPSTESVTSESGPCCSGEWGSDDLRSEIWDFCPWEGS